MLTDRSATALISFVLTVVLVFSSLIAMVPFYTSGETNTALQVEPTSDLYVEVGDNYFDPDDIEVEPGDEIEFENIGDVDHTVTIEDTEYDEVISPGESVFVTIEEEGVYDLDCTFHPGMDGTITVGEPGPELIDHTLEVEPEEGVEPLEVDIEVSVENVGEESGSIDVIVDGTVEYTLDLPAEGSADNEFTYIFEEVGEYDIEFDHLTETVTVEEEQLAEIVVNTFSIDVDGRELTINAEVENVGNTEDTIELVIADEEVKSVTLGPGETETIVYTYESEEDETYTIELGDESETITVEDYDDDDGGEDDDVDDDEDSFFMDPMILGLLSIIIAVIAGLVFFAMRNKSSKTPPPAPQNQQQEMYPPEDQELVSQSEMDDDQPPKPEPPEDTEPKEQPSGEEFSDDESTMHE